MKFSDPSASPVGAEGEYKPKEPKYEHSFNCSNDRHLVDQCYFCMEREKAHKEKPEVKEENDSDRNITSPLVSSDEDENKSKDMEPKDEKQNTEVNETIGAMVTLKPNYI